MENLINTMLQYEKDFKGFLLSGCENEKEFKTLMKEMIENGDIDEIIFYYGNEPPAEDFVYPFEQWQAIENILALLENFKKDLQ